MSIAKAIMATDPKEREWYEDQSTVNMYARRLLSGNSRILVVLGPDGAMSGITLGDLVPGGLERLRERCANEEGVRLLEGSVLFTPRDKPRPYRAPRTAPVAS